jgi:hypothetical protein
MSAMFWMKPSVSAGFALGSLELLDKVLGITEHAYAKNKDISGGRFIQVLKIYRWHLLRAERCIPATLDQLGTLKHGIRTAERILESLAVEAADDLEGWYLGCSPANNIHRFANTLWAIIMALTAEVQENERLYPELKDAFDRERANYRKMKDEAEEAESL